MTDTAKTVDGYWCANCQYGFYEENGLRLYECATCGTTDTNNCCDQCNTFKARAEELGCPECGAPAEDDLLVVGDDYTLIPADSYDHDATDTADLFDDLLQLIPPHLRDESGELFYTGRSAFAQPSPVYLLGLNPGGDPALLAGHTIGAELAEIRDGTRRPDWCAYSDEPWQGYEKGRHPYQASILRMYGTAGLNPRQTPASNAIFVRTRSEADLKNRKAELLQACWPVHKKIIEVLGVQVVIALGAGAGGWVRKQLGADREIDIYRETNNRKLPSRTFVAPDGIQVVHMTHPSRFHWTVPAQDPSELVRRALDRATC